MTSSRGQGDGEAHHSTRRALRWAIFSLVNRFHRFVIDGLRGIEHGPPAFDRSAVFWGRVLEQPGIGAATLHRVARVQSMETICLRDGTVKSDNLDSLAPVAHR